MAPTLPTPPSNTITLSLPHPHVLLVTLSRPKALNSISTAGHHDLHAIWTWMDNEPSIRVGILTGSGRAFCAGADLKGNTHTPTPYPPQSSTTSPPQHNTHLYICRMELHRPNPLVIHHHHHHPRHAPQRLRGPLPTERQKAYHLRSERALPGGRMRDGAQRRHGDRFF